jgi:hypothetical protein
LHVGERLRMAGFDMKQEALEVALGGLRVFPVKLDKSPLTPHGFKDATTDPDEIGQLGECFPEAIIGTPAGADAGFDVLDVDGEMGRESLREYEVTHGSIADTAVVETGGGGLHYFLRHDPLMGNRTGFLPGIDVRGDGGYVILPPSQRHAWQGGLRPWLWTVTPVHGLRGWWRRGRGTTPSSSRHLPCGVLVRRRPKSSIASVLRMRVDVILHSRIERSRPLPTVPAATLQEALLSSPFLPPP